MATTDVGLIVSRIEREHGVRAIQSETKRLFYLEDDDKEDIGILVIRKTVPMHIVLSTKQAYTLAKELKEVLDMAFYKYD